uniref:Uncharacterized protein n=1 Tax=Romanomermis culicivorax TaxID=13658 RepID=A0A915K5K5_ROMCU
MISLKEIQNLISDKLLKETLSNVELSKKINIFAVKCSTPSLNACI